MQSGDRADVAAATRRRDVLIGLCQGGVIAAAALAVYFYVFDGSFRRAPLPSPVVSKPPAVARTAAPAPQNTVATALPVSLPAIERKLDFGDVRPPADVSQVAAWAVRDADNGDRAFAIVDKRRAQVYVFAAGGGLIGTSPVLLGYAAGDDSVAGIGTKPIDQIQPHERTTPAGRFEAAPGRNTLGDDVVWVDYDAAVSMHRVRATNPAERRLERLATKTASDNRISWGCINVPVAFFNATVWPNIGKRGAIVYVLPESRPLATFFPAAASVAPTAQVLAQAVPVQGNSANP